MVSPLPNESGQCNLQDYNYTNITLSYAQRGIDVSLRKYLHGERVKNRHVLAKILLLMQKFSG
jgi:hypothetical protein